MVLKKVNNKTNTNNGEAKKKPQRSPTWSTYIYRVLIGVHFLPGIGISQKAMMVMDNFMDDIFEKLTMQASQLFKRTKKRTLNEDDIEAAVKLLVPGELGKHAISEGGKAVLKYKLSMAKDRHNYFY